MGPKAKRNKRKRDAEAAAAEIRASNASQPAQPNHTNPRPPPRGKLDHLTRSELELRRVALGQAERQVSSKLKAFYRRSRVAAVALGYIIDEKGLQLPRPEEVADFWGLDIHPRDLDGAGQQSYNDIGGRQVLDYGDLQGDYFEPRHGNPFKPREEAKVIVKKEVEDDGDSTMVESVEEPTVCGYIDPENKENVLEFVERMGWQPAKKRKADEFDADHYDHDEERETDPKRAKKS